MVHLPNEIFLPILIYASNLRGLTRALRLRLVDKRFAALVPTAIFASGLLRTEEHRRYTPRLVPFWQSYFTYLAMRHPDPEGDYLAGLRRVAEFIVRWRHSKASSVLDTAEVVSASRLSASSVDWPPAATQELSECVWEVTYPMLMCVRGYLHLDGFFEPDKIKEDYQKKRSRSGRLSDTDRLLKVVLSAAAYLGEEVLVSALVKEGHDYDKPMSNFPDPFESAFHGGNSTIMRILLANMSENEHLRYRTRRVTWWSPGSKSDQLEVCNAYLDKWQGHIESEVNMHSDLAYWVQRTHNVLILEKYYSIISNLGKWSFNNWLKNAITRPAESGAIDTVVYLLSVGALVDGRFCDGKDEFARPISLAAKNGHHEVVRLLLEAGATPDRALEAACLGGYKASAVLLLRKETNIDIVRMAFVRATERKYVSMIRFLLQEGSGFDQETKNLCLEKARSECLDSTLEFLETVGTTEQDWRRPLMYTIGDGPTAAFL